MSVGWFTNVCNFLTCVFLWCISLVMAKSGAEKCTRFTMFKVHDTFIQLCAFVGSFTMSNQPELCLKIYFVPRSKHSPSWNITKMHLNSSNCQKHLNFYHFHSVYSILHNNSKANGFRLLKRCVGCFIRFDIGKSTNAY